ncbi:MAG: hypothetical protein E7336_06545 [Clostridiales bacterium]|nr:hypothetical protein [Clostridiales bacterium]
MFFYLYSPSCVPVEGFPLVCQWEGVIFLAFCISFSEVMDMEKDGLGNHTLSMENRQRAALTGIAEVLAFDENQVILRTDTGEIALAGENLHVTKLMLDEGQLVVEGKIDGVFYTQKKPRRSFFGRKGP